MTTTQCNDWLTTYGKAWMALDADAVMQMVARDSLVYYESTFTEPTSSWDEVNKLWQVIRTNQKDVSFWHEILMTDRDAVLAHVKISRTLVPSGEQQHIDAAFLFKINDQGLCTYFRQWRMMEP